MSNQLERVARVGAWIVLALLFVTQPARAVGPFRSPVEIATEACSKAALALHLGKIERTEVLYGAKAVRIEVHVTQNDGKGWIVLCDGTSGKILNTIDVDAP